MNKLKKAIIPAVLLIALFLFFKLTTTKDVTDIYFGEAVGRTYSVTTTTPGLLASLKVSIGDEINVNDLVATVENNDLDYQIQLAASNKIIAKNQLDKGTSPAREEELNILDNKLSSLEANKSILYNSVAATKLTLEDLRLQTSINLSQLNDIASDYENNKSLFLEGAISQQVLDKSALSYSNQEIKYSSSKLQSRKLNEELKSLSSKIILLELDENSISQNIEIANKGLSSYDRSIAIANLENAETSENRLIEKGENRNIYTKQSGIVENINYELGEYISPGMSLITVYDTEIMSVKIYVHEKNLPNIKIGDEISVTLASNTQLTALGTITYIANESMFTPFNIVTVEDRERLVYEIELSLPRPEFLHPGMLLQIELEDGDTHE